MIAPLPHKTARLDLSPAEQFPVELPQMAFQPSSPTPSLFPPTASRSIEPVAPSPHAADTRAPAPAT